MKNILKNTDITSKKEANDIFTKMMGDVYDKRVTLRYRPVLYIDESIDLKKLTSKLRSSKDFIDQYERSMGSLILEAFGGDEKNPGYLKARKIGIYWVYSYTEFNFDSLGSISREKLEIIGDARGTGLFIGVELVKDLKTKEPASEKAKVITNKMKEMGILLSTDGSHNNVLKIKPPMVFTIENAQLVIDSLERLFPKLS